ncbi:MAG: hypothetical protein QM703_23610 [Gemmatales bacterium]
MTRKITVAALVTLCGWTMCILLAQDSKQDSKKDQPLNKLMEHKLETSKNLLGAVAKNDFVKAGANAEELARISLELGKRYPNNLQFQDFGKEYRNELQGLLKAVRKQNTEGMTLAYVKVTMSCFNCHTYVRETRMAMK